MRTLLALVDHDPAVGEELGSVPDLAARLVALQQAAPADVEVCLLARRLLAMCQPQTSGAAVSATSDSAAPPGTERE